ncbi:MAG: hypothetical protein JW797_10710 [Bradymonadales bacterium]|nr:hypothetical protein [Bradymonadales bacterium]
MRTIANVTLCLAAWLLLAVLHTPTAWTQDTSVFDEQGNLVRMPFTPDIPVVRSATRHQAGRPSFYSYSSMAYQRAVAHYQDLYQRQVELAPGWRLFGYGYEVATDAYVFTLVYADQVYRLEIHPDPESGGCILVVRSRGGAMGHQPHFHSIMPLRASDIGPMSRE